MQDEHFDVREAKNPNLRLFLPRRFKIMVFLPFDLYLRLFQEIGGWFSITKLSRPELLLLLLYQPGPEGQVAEPIVGKTRLMKLLFLLSKEANIDDFLSHKQEFVPFKYGPFDAEVYDDLDALKELKLIEETPADIEESDSDTDTAEQYDTDTRYKLTAQGVAKARELTQTVPKEVLRRVTNVKSLFGKMPLGAWSELAT